MILLEEYDGRGVKLITHLHVVPRLRMSGDLERHSYSPCTSSRRREEQFYL
jgi:hypothetical protein